MAATPYDIEIEAGATFRLPIIWKDGDGVAVNLTGYTARMQIRPVANSPTVLASLTTENGGITLGGSTGEITLFMAPADTAAITRARGVYDLELQSGSGEVTRLLKGCVTISPEVTR